MRKIVCPLCGSAEFTIVFPEKLFRIANEFDYLTESPSHYRIVRCRSCELQYSNPIYDEETINKLYEAAGIENTIDPDDLSAIRKNMQRYVRRLMGDSKLYTGKILDVGCGTGDLLEIAAGLGLQITGVEPCVAAAKHATKRLGEKSVVNGPYNANLFVPNNFDLISIIHVLDHVIDPLGLLKTAYSHLRPGGHLIGATHNISSLLARLSGEKFIAYSVQHICYFDRLSLRSLFERAGFEVISVRGSLTTYPLRHYVRNGIRNVLLRGFVLRISQNLGVEKLPFTFPFGNIEVIGKKPMQSTANE